MSPRHSAPAIGLLDHMGYGNLGDAAIQDAVIANIRKRLPDAQLVGFSFIPDDTVKRHGIPCHPIRWWYPTLGEPGGDTGRTPGLAGRLKAALKRRPRIHAWARPLAHLAQEVRFWLRSYRVLRTLDVLIFSGGGQLGELWRGPWSHPFAIFKFAVLAKLARTKVYFLNVGAGPLEHPLSRFFVRWAVRMADYRSFRDDDSHDLVRRIGVKAEMHVYPDPVYALDVAHHAQRRPSRAVKPVVGLNPIGFCDPRLWPRKDERVYQEYLDKTARFCTWLLDEGYRLRVFTNEMSVDRYAIADLKSRLRERGIAPAVISDAFRDPSPTVQDVLDEMTDLDYIVTAKFHGIIFSHLLARPVIALSYHKKMDSAMQALGHGRFCADIERFDLDWLTAAFRALRDEDADIKAACGAAVQANAARLSQQFDRLFVPAGS